MHVLVVSGVAVLAGDGRKCFARFYCMPGARCKQLAVGQVMTGSRYRWLTTSCEDIRGHMSDMSVLAAACSHITLTHSDDRISRRFGPM